MDFRSASSDQKLPVDKLDSNRPPPYQHPTTDVHPHQPLDQYHVGASHGQRQDNHGKEHAYSFHFSR